MNSKKITLLFFSIVLKIGNIQSQTYIDKYVNDPNLVYTTIAGPTEKVAVPTDLDFKPYTNELWVLNKSTTAIGGTTVIISNAGLPGQTSVFKKDGNARHFMASPPAFAMGDNETFATVEDVLDANFSGGDFTGPSLWSCDPRIYAVVGSKFVPAYNGSHISMLHQSPYSMGIAFDTLHKYWVFDGQNKSIVSYDFDVDHGPGRDDHSKGKIHRYKDVVVTRLANVPSHMVLDKKTGWLYICEPAKSRILRMNTKTGVKNVDLPQNSEPLTEFWEMKNTTWEVYINTGVSKPVGIDLAEGRLVVSDYANGDIIIYNITGASPVEVGRIATGQAGIMGLKLGTDGRIWFVNNTQNKVVRIDHTPVTNDAAILNITNPAEQYVCATSLVPEVTLLNNGSAVLTQATINYNIAGGASATYNWTGSLAAGASVQLKLPSIALTAGYKKFSVWVNKPNNTSDENTLNDKKVIYLKTSTSSYNLPFTEGFQNTTFPPADWQYNSPTDWPMANSLPGENIWSRVTTAGGMGSSSASARMDNRTTSMGSSCIGQSDDLITPVINCSSSAGNLTLTFNVAYARYNTSSDDSLVVLVSKDCELTWTNVYGKSGSALSTGPDKTTPFTPSATQWRTETINLNSYAGVQGLKIRFHSLSDNGNNLFIDDIKLSTTSTVGMKEVFEMNPADVQVFPNPGSGEFYLTSNITANEDVMVSLFNIVGEQLHQQSLPKRQDGSYYLDYTQFPSGVYIVQFNTNDQKYFKRIVISR